MNFKTTWALVILALGLFAFIYFHERHLPGLDQAATGPEPLLPSFSPRTISRIEIIRSNQLTRVDRTNGTWFLTSLDYPARQDPIEHLLARIASLENQAVLTDDELLARPQAVIEYGLNPPQANVVLEEPGHRIQLLLGYKALIGDQVYLQLIGKPGVFFADAALWDSLPGSPDDWRDPTFLRLGGFPVDQIEVRAAAPHGFLLELNPTDRLWQITKPTPARADSARVSLLLDRLRATTIRRWLTDQPRPDLESCGLQPPVLEVVLAQGTNALLAGQLGKSPTNEPSLVYARTAADTNVVLVPRELLDALLVSFREFQDRRLVALAPTNVAVIEGLGQDRFVLQRQTNGAWQFVEPPNLPADSGLVRDFLTRLADLRIEQFEKDVVTEQDFATYGLAPPALQYTLRGPLAGTENTNRPTAQVRFGTNTLDKVYARRGEESSLFAVRLYETLRLPRAGFQLRERRIWDFAPTNVLSLTLYEKGQTRKVVRNAQGEWILPPMFRGRLNPLVVDALLEELGRLAAVAWVAKGKAAQAQYGFPLLSHQLSVEIATPNGPVTHGVEFGSMSPSGNPYASTLVDGQPTIFEFPASAFDICLILAHDLFESFSAGGTP